jgi:heme-degrading monooxygenase HmoA
MLLERSEISVKQGTEEAFLKVMQDKGLPILKNSPGVLKAELGRGVENPNKFLFLVEWGSLEDHTAFNQNDVHQEFVELFGPFAQGGAMEHFRMVPSV